MSLKAYDSYRIKKGYDPFIVLLDLKAKAQETARDQIKRLYWDWLGNPQSIAEIRKELNLSEDQEITPFRCADYLRDKYKAVVTDPYRSLWNLDLCLVVHEHRKRIYVTPRGGCFIRLDEILAADERLEEYRYWNNTDMPEDMSPLEWKRRDRIWNAICDNWSRHLVVDILTYEGFYLVDPSWDEEMIAEWNLRKNSTEGRCN